MQGATKTYINDIAGKQPGFSSSRWYCSHPQAEMSRAKTSKENLESAQGRQLRALLDELLSAFAEPDKVCKLAAEVWPAASFAYSFIYLQ